jgi:hypothetical protein
MGQSRHPSRTSTTAELSGHPPRRRDCVLSEPSLRRGSAALGDAGAIARARPMPLAWNCPISRERARRWSSPTLSRRTRGRRPGAHDRRPCRSCIREKQRRRADCSYPCNWAAGVRTAPVRPEGAVSRGSSRPPETAGFIEKERSTPALLRVVVGVAQSCGPGGAAAGIGQCVWTGGGAGPPPGPSQAAAAAIWCLWSFIRLWVAVLSRHSERTADLPRRWKRSIRRLCLVCANTGSTIALRRR